MASTANRTSTSSSHERKRSTGKRSGRKPSASAVARTASKRLGSVAKETSKLTRSARTSGRKLERTVSDAVEDNPLIVGAALFVAGAALGYAMRGVFHDSLWFEEQREAVMAKAKELARTASDKVGSLSKQNRSGEPNEAH